MKILESDKRVRRTKLAFRQALRKLLSQKDLRNITVKELCALADVNRGTFYAHYNEVHDIIDEMQREMELSVQEMLDNVNSANETREAIANHLYQMVLHMANHKEMCDILLSRTPEEDFHIRMSKLASKYLANSYTSQTPEEQILTENLYCFISGGCMSLMRKWVRDGMKESPEEIARISLKLINHFFSIL